jgi:hypothetical protein
MKTLFISVIILMIPTFLYPQINAVTETGDPVFLYSDGTWKYVNDSINHSSEIIVNSEKFLKDKELTFMVKSNKINIGVWVNPKKWSFTKGSSDESAEFKFENKNDDLYGMLISEKTQIPVETLKTIALENAKNAAPDVRIIKEEYRTVNGITALMMQMSATIQGIRFIYFGYYYSNANGSIQLISWTGENIFQSSSAELEEFLNGLVEL